MKLILFLVASCLALHNGKGAPKRAVYKFVRCNPEGDQANCVIHQSPEMEWSPELPKKLPASTAQYLEAEPVVEERAPEEEEREEEDYEEEGDYKEEEEMIGEEGESPALFLPEESSGDFEGSAAAAFVPAEGETGSGESWVEKKMDLYKGGATNTMRRLFPSRSLVGEAKPEEQELREDHLLQY